MSTQTIESNSPAELTERFINQTNQSIFLTGKAGTGKTTLLKKIISSTYKNTVIVAPTGIAALNAGGVTIHSFFQLPFAGFIPEFGNSFPFNDNVKFENKESLKRHFKMNRQRQTLIRNLELLIIDEVSMLRADLLDAMDWTMRNVRRSNEAFGGVQVLYIGDLLQLPPVVKNEEWNILKNHYSGMYFFNARVIQEQRPLYIELTKIYRQQDSTFIEILNNLRNNRIDQSDIEVLNDFVKPDFDSLKHEGYITLTTHNRKADEMNSSALKSLKNKSFFYNAEIKGDFPKHLYPLEEELELKIGAQIMFIKNDISFEKNFYNGKMGQIVDLSDDEISVRFPDENKTITVEKFEWTNVRYSLNENTGEITEETLGTFVHYPIKLAWAITVHKSQGLTFDKAVLDVSEVFAPGQAYVALSRLRTLGGLVLLKPIRMNGLSNDVQVVAYAQNKATEDIMHKSLEQGTKNHLLNSLLTAFDWYDLTSQWAIHEKTYQMAGSKSEKGKNKSWIALQNQAIQSTTEPARKFRNQLQNLFAAEKADLNFILERVQSAYEYFFKILDNVLLSTLKMEVEMSKIRKTKGYLDELLELDESLTETILRIKKARILMESTVSGRELTKELFWNDEIKNYKIAKIAVLKQSVRQSPSLLDMETEDEEPIILRKAKKTKEKVEKKHTYDITLEMFEAGKTIKEIADIRQFSEQTIVNHLVNLIKAEKVELDQVLEEKRISKLKEIFEKNEGMTLSQIKEKLGNKITWDEMKLYQASTIR